MRSWVTCSAQCTNWQRPSRTLDRGTLPNASETRWRSSRPTYHFSTSSVMQESETDIGTRWGGLCVFSLCRPRSLEWSSKWTADSLLIFFCVEFSVPPAPLSQLMSSTLTIDKMSVVISLCCVMQFINTLMFYKLLRSVLYHCDWIESRSLEEELYKFSELMNKWNSSTWWLLFELWLSSEWPCDLFSVMLSMNIILHCC